MTTATPELLTVSDVMARLKVGRSKVYDLPYSPAGLHQD